MEAFYPELLLSKEFVIAIAEHINELTIVENEEGSLLGGVIYSIHINSKIT